MIDEVVKDPEVLSVEEIKERMKEKVCHYIHHFRSIDKEWEAVIIAEELFNICSHLIYNVVDNEIKEAIKHHIDNKEERVKILKEWNSKMPNMKIDPNPTKDTYQYYLDGKIHALEELSYFYYDKILDRKLTI